MATRIGGTSGVRVHVAAFGKHPGWDDHIENIGMDSDRLVWVKRLLYTEGLAGNIDSGAWEKLEDAQRLPGFGHAFVWRTPDGTVVGRMWSSRDGKGRTKYPMVVCALIGGASAGWAVREVMPRLAQIESKVKETQSAEIVRLAIGEARRALEDAAVSDADTGDAESERVSRLKQLCDSPRVAAEGDVDRGLTRVLYEIEREMLAFRPGGSAAKSSIMDSRGQHIRTPTISDEPGASCLAWLALMEREITASTPVLLIEPVGNGHVDIIVGEPTASTLFCVRSAESRIPPATQVPYNIDAAFADAAGLRIGRWRSGVASPTERDAAAVREKEPARVGGGIIPWLIVAGILAAVAIIALLVLGGGGGNTGGAPAAGQPRDRAAAPTEPADTRPADAGGDTTRQTVDRTEPAPRPEPVVRPEPSRPVVQEPPTPPADGDPRPAWRIDEAIAEARSGVETLRRAPAGEVTVSLDRLSQSLDSAAERADAVRARPYSAEQRATMVADIASIDAQVLEVGEQVRSAARAQAGRVSDYLLQRAQSRVAEIADLQRAYEGRLRQLDPSMGMESAQEAANALESAVKQADLALAERPPAIPEDSTLDAGALQSATSVRRDAAVRAAAAAIAAGAPEQAHEAATQYRAWVGEAAGIVERGLRTERLLRNGYLPGERGDGGVTIDELLAGLENAPAGSAALVVQPLVRRVESVRRVSSLDDVESVIAAADRSALEASGRGATDVLAAWMRLGGLGWPRTIDGLTKATELKSGPVAAAVGSVGDAARRKVVEEAVAAEAERMWLTFGSASGATEEGLAALVASRERLGVPETASERLPAWVRYNLARIALQRDVERAFALPETERDEAARVAATKFVTAVRAITPGVGSAPAASGLVEVASGAQRDADRTDLSGLGPARLGWTVEIGEDGAVATYRRAGGPAVTFRRAPQGEVAGDTVSYVSVGEVSLSLFNAIASDAQAAEALRGLMLEFSLGVTDPRGGVRTWDWSRRAGEMLTPARADAPSNGWLRRKPLMEGRSYYPAGMQVAPPAEGDPVTWISPVAAAYLARSAGCRLPTEAEWRRCVQAADTSGANRRDASWGRVFAFVQASLVAQQPEWPGAGVFWPEGVARVQSHQDSTLAVEGDDGRPWFGAAATPGSGFGHLIGNAAEFVVVSPEPPAIDTLTPAAVETALSAAGVAVVGASAVSPPAVDPLAAYPVSLARASNGFSDVGFRLAFSAPKGLGQGSFAQRLRTAMEGSGLMDGQ